MATRTIELVFSLQVEDNADIVELVSNLDCEFNNPEIVDVILVDVFTE